MAIIIFLQIITRLNCDKIILFIIDALRNIEQLVNAYLSVYAFYLLIIQIQQAIYICFLVNSFIINFDGTSQFCEYRVITNICIGTNYVGIVYKIRIKRLKLNMIKTVVITAEVAEIRSRCITLYSYFFLYRVSCKDMTSLHLKYACNTVTSLRKKL